QPIANKTEQLEAAAAQQFSTYSNKAKETAYKPIDYYNKQEAFYRGLFWICVLPLEASREQAEIKELANQLKHYQTLYQKRVAQDLDANQLQSEIQALNQALQEKQKLTKYQAMLEQKIEDLGKQLIFTARQKIKGKKAAEELGQLAQTEQKETELNSLIQQKEQELAQQTRQIKELEQEYQEEKKELASFKNQFVHFQKVHQQQVLADLAQELTHQDQTIKELEQLL
ncbi:1465_t:CDS:2, partial [Ambispora gerdemannii]